ncbi:MULTISPECIES: LytR/AlgR family response regulator transcription factor [Spirosoma]|uniref:Response regulator transcription factor n=1 Tax=Spirosoma sordidisoli TaxID=2502893 RepID=A0A4Q2US22_9BACT|nr:MULTISPECIES: LytTR family DNA-binding domain-containing protein [Spirosoma]RYC70490.1 response regulator transcription factor [Spirosoma sordidisoli]
MLNAILIDDDQSNLSSLGEKLGRHCPQIRIVARCDNARDGQQAIDRLQPDVVFLDIEMPVMNGFLMLQHVSYRQFALIFVTAYDHYAIKAIRYSALDYLVKPVDIDELKAAVAKAEANRTNQSAESQVQLLLEYVQKKQPRRIGIPTFEGLQFVNIDDIIYLEASANYTYIHLTGSLTFLVSRTLKEFDELLPTETFLRIHHAHMINKSFVERYIRGDGGQVVMSNGVTLDVAKRKKAEFLQAISF